MDDYEIETVCRRYLGMGLQDWGQTAEERENATRKYVAAAGKKFGTKEADEWLAGVVSNLQRGEFWNEVAQLGDAIRDSILSNDQKDAVR
jgi:hypothetical protein